MYNVHAYKGYQFYVCILYVYTTCIVVIPVVAAWCYTPLDLSTPLTMPADTFLYMYIHTKDHC